MKIRQFLSLLLVCNFYISCSANDAISNSDTDEKSNTPTDTSSESAGQNTSADTGTESESPLEISEFEIGDRESLTREEFAQIICDTIQRCDPEGYVEFVEARGECMPEIVEWVLVCDIYDPKAAVECLKGATLDHLTTFNCGRDNMDANVGAEPEACNEFCKDDDESTVPREGK